MDKFAFAPLIDLPLVSLTLAAFLWHFNEWAGRDDIDTNVDVSARLPTARLRVTVLFAGVLVICWFANLAVWSIFALLLGFGLVVAIIASGNADGGWFGFLAAAYLIREWSFGFPQLILHPQPTEVVARSEADPGNDLAGKIGTIVAPLRPTGNVEIDGDVVSAVSGDGTMIDAGTEVVVTGVRNGCLCVRPRS